MAATSRGLRRLSGTHGQAARFIFPAGRKGILPRMLNNYGSI